MGRRYEDEVEDKVKRQQIDGKTAALSDEERKALRAEDRDAELAMAIA